MFENLRLLKCPILGICKGLCRFVTLYKVQCCQLYLFWLSWKKLVILWIKIEKLATLINLNTWWTHKKFSLVEWKMTKTAAIFVRKKDLKLKKKSSSTRKKKLYREKNSLWLGLLSFIKIFQKIFVCRLWQHHNSFDQKLQKEVVLKQVSRTSIFCRKFHNESLFSSPKIKFLLSLLFGKHSNFFHRKIWWKPNSPFIYVFIILSFFKQKMFLRNV